tara:strand:+ start:560 stop:1594 length:1035 start_codon:yes stop_codon:yes gene_type:complete
MSTAANQNLSLGKLKRAVDGTDSYTTANTSLGSQNDGSSQTKMSDFSISEVSSVSGYAYLWEQTSETYTLNFSSAGSLFLSKIASRTANITWSTNNGLVSVSGDYTGTATAGAISNANTGTGDDSDFFPAGTNNTSVNINGKYNDDGQSDGFNDHAVNYNANLTKAVTVVDAYGGSPSCLLVGTKIDMADGTTKLVEDLDIGDWVLSMNMPGQIDEDEEDWRKCRFADEKTETFTQHSASVQDINFDFVRNYWNINNGEECITGDHEMLYKPLGENTWMWQLVPNMKVGAHLMDKNGEEVLITQLENVTDEDGFEVVQIDVEPLDVYFGKTFLVHNKGSDSNPF